VGGHETGALETWFQHDVEHAGGELGLDGGLSKHHGGDGGERAGAQHHRVAGDEGGDDFPQSGEEGEIIGGDGGDHADGGVAAVALDGAALGGDAMRQWQGVFLGLGEGLEQAEDFRGLAQRHGDLGGHGIAVARAAGLAHDGVLGFRPAFYQRCNKAAEDFRAGGSCEAAPAAVVEGAAGGADCCLDLAC